MKSRSLFIAVIMAFLGLVFSQALWAAVVSGTIESVTADKRKLVLKLSGDKPKQVFSIPDGVTITLDGRTVKLDALKEGQQMTVFSTNDGAVTKLTARAAKANPDPGSTPSEPPAPKAKKTKIGNAKSDDSVSERDGGDSPQFRGPRRDGQDRGRNRSGLPTGWAKDTPQSPWPTVASTRWD